MTSAVWQPPSLIFQMHKDILAALYLCHTSRWMRALETIEQISNRINHSLNCHHLLYCKAHISSVSSFCICFQVLLSPFLSIPFTWSFKELIYAGVSFSHHCFFFWHMRPTESVLWSYIPKVNPKKSMKHNLIM